MIYVTLLDQFHPGIYSSQVIDVCDYLNKHQNAKIRLIAFLSIRELVGTDARRKLKQLAPKAIVLPSFPGLRNFEWTAVFLFFVCLFTGERIAICRNVFCVKMALHIKKLGLLKKVVLDGRSALAAEAEEYDVFPVEYIRKNIKRIEEYAVRNSDFRIAVSNTLVNYWITHYNYRAGKEVVIPCTLDNKHFNASVFSIDAKVSEVRKELGLSPEDIVLVYSGSSAPWQSFELLDEMLSPVMEGDKRIKVLLLTKENNNIVNFSLKHKGRVFIRWLSHKDVLAFLHCCDYGLLLREQSDTNKVASPVKFAEYLYSGLPVLISENLGDFSEFVELNKCGYVLRQEAFNWSLLKRPDIQTKVRCFTLAKENFMKGSKANEEAYRTLLRNVEQLP